MHTTAHCQPVQRGGCFAAGAPKSAHNLKPLGTIYLYLNCVAEFAGDVGSVQGINYPLTTCASHLYTNGLENKLATLVGTVPEWLEVMNH